MNKYLVQLIPSKDIPDEGWSTAFVRLWLAVVADTVGEAMDIAKNEAHAMSMHAKPVVAQLIEGNGAKINLNKLNKSATNLS